MNTNRVSGRRGISAIWRNRTVRIWVAGSGLFLIIVLSLAGWLVGRRSQPENTPLFAVRRGRLTISVKASGNIRNRDEVVVKSQVEGRTTILSLVPEGIQVKKGDLLVELDASKLEDRRVQQQITVLNAEAAYIRARENLAVTKSQTESNIAQAELDYKFAQLDLKKYLEGEYPQKLQQAKAQITIAQEELQRAKDKLDWSGTLAKEGYITQMELQADELAAKRSELDLELAQGKLRVLEKFTYQRNLEKLRSDVQQCGKALERITRQASADIVQDSADLRAKESQFNREKSKLAKIGEQIAKCMIRAPVAGMVVYATTGQGGWRGNVEPLDEGQEVRERQELIKLPTTSSMMAEVKVHESSLRKIADGMPVQVTVDAIPGTVFTGRVGKIALLPDAQSAWLNPDLKVYSTEIYLDGDGSMLRPGMTCMAEIIVQRYSDALYVPVQSVVRVEGKPVVYILGASGPAPRQVCIGLDNNRMICILEGLKGNEKVLLAPPLGSSAVPLERSGQDDPHQAETSKTTTAPASEPVKEHPHTDNTRSGGQGR